MHFSHKLADAGISKPQTCLVRRACKRAGGREWPPVANYFLNLQRMLLRRVMPGGAERGPERMSLCFCVSQAMRIDSLHAARAGQRLALGGR